MPVKDKVYTVRELTHMRGVPGLRLVEIVNEPHDYDGGMFCECAFGVRNFRPVVEKKEYKAMEIFRKIAANPKIEIKEDA